MSVTEAVPEIDIWAWSSQKSPPLDTLLDVKHAVLTHHPLRRQLEARISEIGDETSERRVVGLARWMLAQYPRAYELLKDCSTGERGVRYALGECCLKGRIKHHDRETPMRRPDVALKLLAEHPEVDSDERIFQLLIDAALCDNDTAELSKIVATHGKNFQGTAALAYAEGRLAEAEADYRTARTLYEKAIEIDSAHRASLLRLAYQLDLGGDDEAALALYRRLADLRPTDLHALLNYGVLLEDHGRFEEAVRVYELASRAHPTHSHASTYLKDALGSLSMTFDEETEKRTDNRRQVLRIPITDFELSVRSRNCLARMGVDTLGDLVVKTEAELLAYKNFGETSLSEIKILLESRGLRLGMNLAEDAIPAMIDPVPEAQTPEIEAPGQVDLPPGVDPAILDRVLADLDLSIRVRRALGQLQVVTVGDLVQRHENELLGLKNFGQTSMNELKSRLAEFGLSLRTS